MKSTPAPMIDRDSVLNYLNATLQYHKIKGDFSAVFEGEQLKIWEAAFKNEPRSAEELLEKLNFLSNQRKLRELYA